MNLPTLYLQHHTRNHRQASHENRPDIREVQDIVYWAYDFFPTLNPGTAGFLIADLDPVLYLSSLTNPHALSSVNEIFLDLNDPMDDTMTAISNEVGRGGEIYATKGLLEQLDSDPLISAGWKLMSSISITVALYIAVLGYFIHMILNRVFHFG